MEEYRAPQNRDEPDLLPEELLRAINRERGGGLPEDPLAEAGAYRPVQPFPQERVYIPEPMAEPEEEPAYEPEPEPRQPAIRAYNNDFADKGMQNVRRKPTQAQKAAQAQLLREARMARQLREEQEARRRQLEQQTEAEFEEPVQPRRRKRRGCGCLLWLLIVLALLATLAFGAVKLLGRLPAANGTDRRSGISSVLLAGVDADGLRTDTLMLVSVDREEKTYNILSIPRDTLTFGDYPVPKINGAYGWYGCGEAGMDALMDLIEENIGFRPDKYVLVDFTSVTELVDLMGGIECEVPMEMEVEGVKLQQGVQKLNGEQVLAVLRFRSGYAMADLQRVEVQRSVIAAAMDQWLSPRNLPKLQEAAECIEEKTMTDLTVFQMAALALEVRECQAGGNYTLPGEAKMIGDGSYYVLDPAAVCGMINTYFSPYEEDITPEDLYIKVG